MKFSTPALVEQVVWDMRLADSSRGYLRMLVDRLFNGQPPLLPEDVKDDPDKTNVNFLRAPILAADARRSYYNGFIKPGLFFHAQCDADDPMKRDEWSNTFTQAINRTMKRSRRYFEFLRSQFALTVLHGIGPGFWFDRDHWCPECLGVEDILIPGNTLLSLHNLDHFAVYRQYTFMQLYRMTHGHKVDPRWNMPVVEEALKWVKEQTQSQLSYTDIFMPQKTEERMKQDLGLFGTDVSPTVDCWDFYYWCDEGKSEGWRRCMILESPMPEQASGLSGGKPRMPLKNKYGIELGKNGNWLYKPDERTHYAAKVDEIVHFQFGDLNATAPFRYHSTRSLGWLLYSICHLDNRARCRFMDAFFESTLQYFRLSNPSDREKVTKIDLHDKGILPEGVDFIPADQRWKLDPALLQLTLVENQRMIQDAASQYRETPHGSDKSERDRVTATEIMADVNRANALVGGMLLQAYEYARFQYQEILRRFCRKDSKDPDVKAFRTEMLQAGIPEKWLVPSAWEVEPERVLGQGNQMMQIAIADKLMAIRGNLDPQSQREVDHIYVLANADPDTANRLVPMTAPRKSESIRDASMMVGSLMFGIPVPPGKRDNPSEMIETLMRSMVAIIGRNRQQPDKEDIRGLGFVAQAVAGYIQRLHGNKQESAKVKRYTMQLKQIMALVKQLQGVAAEAQPVGNGGPDPQDVAKLQVERARGALKLQQMAKSHQQRTTERDVAARMKLQQDSERHRMELAHKAQDMKLDAAAKDLEAAGNIRRSRLTTLEE